MEIEGQDYLHLPRRDKKKYCDFHHDHGHDTESYLQLKYVIEVLICQGCIGKYV